MLGRRLVGAGRHEQPGLADPVRLELLDDDSIEQWAQDVAHFCVSTLRMGQAHAPTRPRELPG